MTTAVTLQRRTYHYEIKRKGLCDFIDARNAKGEEKYGKGKQNAGYRRDNLMDVLEELTDALKIFHYFFERIGKAADATSVWDVKRINEGVTVYNTLLDLCAQVDELREWVDDNYPKLIEEDVKRLVPFAPQPSDRVGD